MEIAPDSADIGDEQMHEYLLGRVGEQDKRGFISDILKHPESVWINDVPIPNDPANYGPASGLTLPVVTFLTFPSAKKPQQNTYAFPYHNAQYGVFEDMLGPDEPPRFADPDARYPLIIIAHGYSAHGVYDIRHAHDLASHGYIVAVISYGDERTEAANHPNQHVPLLRPYLTKAVLDSLLLSETFGPHIDADNIGITGHSFGGFTALALAGGRFQGNAASVTDDRITAGVIAAPWVGHIDAGKNQYAFGPDNLGLNQVSVPFISFFGTKDEATLASFILPAMKQLSGPTYVVELVDQPHVFEGGSWEDRNNWELLFFSAYLKHDSTALEMLKTADSMKGGNEDRQLFDYQKLTGND
jgi:dienelactone hydrolase